MGVFKRPPYIEYEDALEGFTKARKYLNDKISNSPSDFHWAFNDYKIDAKKGDHIAMDVLAYYYKTGVPNLLPENYQRFLAWELLAGARGNQLAIEKLQFLFNFAFDQIMSADNYGDIVYKNDIDEYNVIYVLGKAICKVLVQQIGIYPLELSQENDDYKPFNQDIYNSFRRDIEQYMPKIIQLLS